MQEQITTKLRLTSILTDWLMMNVGLLSGIVIILIINLASRFIAGDYLALSWNHFLLILLVYIPWLILYIWFDLNKDGSLGKQLLQLTLHTDKSRTVSIFIRNILKWVPVFMIISALIFSFVSHFNPIAVGIIIGSIVWIIINIILLIVTEGQGHLIDKIVKTRVIKKP